MNIDFRGELYTHGKERSIGNDTYTLEKEGYLLFELDEKITIKREKEGMPIGSAVVKALHLEKEKTIITYQLVSLKSVN